MDHFRRLEAHLKDLLSRPSENIEYPLYQALEEAKPLFLKLFDIPPRSAAEKAEIESGTSITRLGTRSISSPQMQRQICCSRWSLGV